MTETMTKDELIEKLKNIQAKGWIKNAREGNSGGVGNTLEDLLGIRENNLPLPNAAEWELKCHRIGSSALITLLHSEPSPRTIRFVPAVLLLKYGWKHDEAGKKYPQTEMSFRQTINAQTRTDRGFGVVVDRENQKVLVSFDKSSVGQRHSEWLETVKRRVGLDELSPQPYWGFKDLFYAAGSKLTNCFFVQAEVKRENHIEYFKYRDFMILSDLSLANFIKAIEFGHILVDFDARTGHNHGTKFRSRMDKLPFFYNNVVSFSDSRML